MGRKLTRNEIDYNRKLGKTLSISLAIQDKQIEERKNKQPTEDNENRWKIFTFIRNQCSTGKNKMEILEALNVQFSDAKYDKYRPYFFGWVCDRLETKKVEKDEEER